MFFTNLCQLGYCRVEFRAPNLQTSVLLAEDVGKRLKALIVEVHLVKKALLWP